MWFSLVSRQLGNFFLGNEDWWPTRLACTHIQHTHSLSFVFHPLMFTCTILATSCTPSSTHEHAHIHVHAHTVHMPSVLNHCPSHSPSIFFSDVRKLFFFLSFYISLSFPVFFFFFFLNNLSYFLFSLNLWSKTETKQLCLIENVPDFFSLWHSEYLSNFFHGTPRLKVVPHSFI